MAGALAGLVEKGLVAPDWAEALAPVDERIAAMGQFLRAEIAAGRPYLPAGDRIFRAFQRPLADVRVLIVGQDPYPNPGHPIGLSFAVDAHVRPLPGSLRNIYQELGTDLGLRMPAHGDLTAWADRGVMLLNRVLTVRPNDSNSHRGRGWEEVTSCAIDALARRGGPAAAILWGAPGPVTQGPARVRPVGRVRPPQPALGRTRASSAPAPSPASTACSRSRAVRRRLVVPG